MTQFSYHYQYIKKIKSLIQCLLSHPKTSRRAEIHISTKLEWKMICSDLLRLTLKQGGQSNLEKNSSKSMQGFFFVQLLPHYTLQIQHCNIKKIFSVPDWTVSNILFQILGKFNQKNHLLSLQKLLCEIYENS